MTRQELIESMVRFDRPLEELQSGAELFRWDWAGPPIAILRREHLLSVLSRWRQGSLSAEEVEDWANLLECRDDLDHDQADLAVADAVFDLANPALQGQLSEIGPRLIDRLMAKSSDP